MIPVLAVAYVNRPELLTAMFDSIDEPIGQVIVLDNSEDGSAPAPPGSIHLPFHHNIGVSAAWNMAIKVTPKAPWWCIVNSDITFGKGDLARLAATVEEGSGALYFMLGMAAFAITRHTLFSVGFFDENFHPAYDDDLDFVRRAVIVGTPVIEVGFSGTHVGSAVIYADPVLRNLNGRTHPANDRYYERKWGGYKQGGECFETPFGRGGHVGDWRLEPERLREQSW